MIIFTFDGKKYSAGMDFYEKNRVVLPDGRVLEAGMWLERLPPIPQNLHCTDDLPFGGIAEAIANHANAAVATEVKE